MLPADTFTHFSTLGSISKELEKFSWDSVLLLVVIVELDTTNSSGTLSRAGSP